MRRLFGEARRERGQWRVDVEAHVAIRLRRLFPRVSERPGIIWIEDNDEICCDLDWFFGRYPVAIPDEDEKHMLMRASSFRRRTESFSMVLSGEVAPRAFELALPPRHYQQVAADLWLRSGGLLVVDELGLGKTIVALAGLTAAETRPALVVVPTHLQQQWANECRKFAPDLKVHILRTGKPYDIVRTENSNNGRSKVIPLERSMLEGRPKQQQLFADDERFPDVIITTYHKLKGWAEVLAPILNGMVYDEAQELRREESLKYEAAKFLSEKVSYSLGLSVGANTEVELRGACFGEGWLGSIEQAWAVAVDAGCLGHTLGGYEILNVFGVHGRGWDGSKFCWKPVEKFVRHHFNGQLVRLSAGGRKTLMTDEHSVFVAKDVSRFEVTPAEDIRVGDVIPMDDGRGLRFYQEQLFDVIAEIGHYSGLCVAVDFGSLGRHDLGLTAWQWQNFHRQGKYGTYLPLDVYRLHASKLPCVTRVYAGGGYAPWFPPLLKLSEFAYLFGFYLGNGWIDTGRICFAVKPSGLSKLLKVLDDCPLQLSYRVVKARGRSFDVRCSHALLRFVFQYFFNGLKSYEKFIPESWILSWSRERRLSLVDGLIDSDGHVSHRKGGLGYAYYNTTSVRLMHSIVVLLRSLGVRCGVSRKKKSLGGVIRGRRIQGRRDSYTVYWSMAALLFGAKTNTSERGMPGQDSRFMGGFAEGKVSRVENVEYDGFVYDFQMSGHPSFVANGLLVHNSATPILNYGGELWSVMNILKPDCLGSKWEFQREWCHQSFGNNYKVKIRDPRAFGHYMREAGLMVRRTRKDVGRELPEVIIVPHHVDCNEKALSGLDDSVAELARIILEQGGAPLAKGQAARDLDWRLRQATGIAKAPYVAAFVKMLLESDETVVLFGWHREVYEIWKDALKDYNPVFFTGTETPSQKEASKEAFLSGKTKLLIMSLRAGSGIDGLQQVCRTVVFGELDWSPGIHEQAIGRLHRDGQTDTVTAYYLQADEGADPVIADVLGVKRQQIEGFRDPDGPLVRQLATDMDRVKKLAESFLEQFAGRGGDEKKRASPRLTGNA